jgi:hypothetical protein
MRAKGHLVPDTTPSTTALVRLSRRRALERAYPLAKQLAEILELEAIEPLATSVKHVRQAIGAELAEHGSMDPGLDPAEGDALTHHALMLEEELAHGG